MDPYVMMQRLWDAVINCTNITHSQLEMSMSFPDSVSRERAFLKIVEEVRQAGRVEIFTSEGVG